MFQNGYIVRWIERIGCAFLQPRKSNAVHETTSITGVVLQRRTSSTYIRF